MLELDLQIASQAKNLPSQAQLELWLAAVLKFENIVEDKELSVRIVDEEESQSLNKQYRGKDKPTNVLSFPFESPAGIELPLMGDLVVCQQVVFDEAKQQSKELLAHWAHMIVHGSLHLLGYDHIKDSDAQIMEAKELAILAELGISDPYHLE